MVETITYTVDKGQLVITKEVTAETKLYKTNVEQKIKMINNRITILQTQITTLTKEKVELEKNLPSLANAVKPIPIKN